MTCRPPLPCLRVPVLLLALGLFALGCDGTEDPPPPSDTLDEDIAVSVANALALQTNGALDFAADLALALDQATAPESAPLTYEGAVTHVYRYSPGTTGWRVTAEGTRGERGAGFYARIRRAYDLAYFAADGTPLTSYDAGGVRAARMQATLTSGTGERETPTTNCRLTSMRGTVTVTGLDTPELAVDGTLTFSGIDRITHGGNVFTALAYTLTLTLNGVRGPTSGRDAWPSAVSGRLTGTYEATYSREVSGELTEQPVSRTVEVDLAEGTGLRVLRLLFGAQTFHADVQTGLLEALAP